MTPWCVALSNIDTKVKKKFLRLPTYHAGNGYCTSLIKFFCFMERVGVALLCVYCTFSEEHVPGKFAIFSHFWHFLSSFCDLLEGQTESVFFQLFYLRKSVSLIPRYLLVSASLIRYRLNKSKFTANNYFKRRRICGIIKYVEGVECCFLLVPVNGIE